MIVSVYQKQESASEPWRFTRDKYDDRVDAFFDLLSETFSVSGKWLETEVAPAYVSTEWATDGFTIHATYRFGADDLVGQISYAATSSASFITCSVWKTSGRLSSRERSALKAQGYVPVDKEADTLM